MSTNRLMSNRFHPVVKYFFAPSTMSLRINSIVYMPIANYNLNQSINFAYALLNLRLKLDTKEITLISHFDTLLLMLDML